MNKYGFFGGSFNPPTNAHIYLAEKVITEVKLNKLFFVPVGNYYPKIGLIDEKHRYEMLKIICNKNEKLDVLDIELGINKNLKAIDAFKLIKEKYSNDDLYYIMGADNLAQISKWKDAEKLIKNFKFVILKRDGYFIDEIVNENTILCKYKNNFKIIDNIDYAGISSTDVRNKLKLNINKTDIPETLREYIKDNKLY